MKLVDRIRAVIGGFLGNQSGVTAPIIAVAFTALVGASGYAIDMGHVAWVQRQLQASADAAALAGALYVATDTTTATSTANAYSGAAGQNNAVVGVTSINTSVTPKCFSSITAPSCTICNPGASGSVCNGLVVTQTATVPTYFLKIFGLNSFTPTATATASAKGGQGTSLNVMVVLDTTASMGNTKDPNCTAPGVSGTPYKIDCARAGAAALLQGLNSATSKVGFMTYPPIDSQSVSAETTCNGGNVNVVAYNSSNPTYQLVGLTNSFTSTSSSAQILVGNGVGGGRNQSCGGIQAKGGVGTYFADAINAAQAALVANGAPNAQNVMIVLSDGDANATSQNVDPKTGAKKSVNECSAAVASAGDAAKAGTWVYTVAYAANWNNGSIHSLPSKPSAGTYGSAGCTTDTGQSSISPCDTMKGMASDPSKFYSDDYVTTNTVVTVTTGKNGKTTTSQSSQSNACTGGGGNSTDLVELFKGISASLTQPRLIPNNTA